MEQRVIVAITGASGAVLGVRLLERLKEFDVERHVIVSAWGARTLRHETDYDLKQVRALADVDHNINDMGAAVSSGSFITSAMVVAPCSMKTLAAIASGNTSDLISRTADVVLKEKRQLTLVVRESPLHEVHLENMLKLARMGASIVPPMVSFYTKPSSLDEMIDHIVTRIMDQIGLHSSETPRWNGELE